MIRKAYWAHATSSGMHPTLHARGEMMDPPHIDHCIDTIRQYMMCNADITPTTWVWDPEKGVSKAKADVAHSCRNFEEIKKWAEQRKLVVDFRTDVHG
jgi:hypothetical protein